MQAVHGPIAVDECVRRLHDHMTSRELLLAESGPMRPSELAARLEVEAPHVTRQAQRLEGRLRRAQVKS